MGFYRQEYWSGVPLPSPKKLAYILLKNCIIPCLNFNMWWLPGFVSHHSALTPRHTRPSLLFHFAPVLHLVSWCFFPFFRCSFTCQFLVRPTTGRILRSHTLSTCLWSTGPVIYVGRPHGRDSSSGITASPAPSTVAGQVPQACEEKAVPFMLMYMAENQHNTVKQSSFNEKAGGSHLCHPTHRKR